MRRNRRRIPMLGLLLLSLWLIAAPAVFAHPAMQPAGENWLEPFVEGIGVSGEVVNPSYTPQGGGGWSTGWQVDVIALAPGETVQGRPLGTPASSPDAPWSARLAVGDHVLFAILGEVSISTEGGEIASLVDGSGLVAAGNYMADTPVGMQYSITNPTPSCATVIRLSVAAVPGMAGARAPEEVPALPGSCGTSHTMFQEEQFQPASATLTARMMLLHSTGLGQEYVRPSIVIGQQAGIVALRGNVGIEFDTGCEPEICRWVTVNLQAPGSITVQPNQNFSLFLTSPAARDEVILLVAGLAPTGALLPLLSNALAG